MNNEKTKLLLIKPQKNNTYIRKLSMSYGYTSILCITDNNNHITEIGTNNIINIKKIKQFNKKEKKIIENKIHKINPNDLMNIYTIKQTIPLQKKIILDKPCNNMRHATNNETIQIKNNLHKQLKQDNIQIINHNNNTSLNINLNLNTNNTPTKHTNIQTTLI